MTANEELPVNAWPVSQLAKKLLDQATDSLYPTDPQYPYLLQLVHYAVEIHPQFCPDPVPKYRVELLEIIWTMYDWTPEGSLLDILAPDTGQTLEEAGSVCLGKLYNLPPREAGAYLSENLYWSLQERVRLLQGVVSDGL